MIERDDHFMRMAARLALRGHGGAEPNPLVGCVIVDHAEQVVGWGYHRRCGGPHAEAEALTRAGERAAGGTAYVTLEPCNHTGRTGPCTQALIAAGIVRVVIARLDPNPIAGGGAAQLQAAGIHVDVHPHSRDAVRLTDPFVHRLTSGLPWIIAKWAQTIDGRLATSAGESRWISSPRSRAMVHRERGRVDAIMTGIGTVLADDPLLTARSRSVRRVAHRIIIDPSLRLPTDSQIAQTAVDTPTVVVCRESAARESGTKAQTLRSRSIEIIETPDENHTPITLAPILRQLAAERSLTNMLVEAGPGLLTHLFRQRLVQEAWVFIAPLMLGDDKALPALRGLIATHITDGMRLHLHSVRQRSQDVVLRYGCTVADSDRP